METTDPNGKPPIRYLVIGCPRSGTTVMHMAMAGHPQVTSLSDEMETTPLFAMGLSTFTCGAESNAERQGGLRALFDAITTITAEPGHTHRGAKVCARSPAEALILVEALRAYLPEVRAILTIRDDLVAQYGSLRKARRSNVWHSWNPGAAAERNRKLKLNGWLFRRYAINTLEVIQTLRTLAESHQVLECSFERLQTEANAIYQEAFSFLDLEPHPVSWLNARKVNPPPADYISNYAGMSRILKTLRSQHACGEVPGHVKSVTNALDQLSKTYYWARRRS